MADIQGLERWCTALSRYEVRECCPSVNDEQLYPVLLKKSVSFFVIEKPVIIHQHRERLFQAIQPLQNFFTMRKWWIGNNAVICFRLIRKEILSLLDVAENN